MLQDDFAQAGLERDLYVSELNALFDEAAAELERRRKSV